MRHLGGDFVVNVGYSKLGLRAPATFICAILVKVCRTAETEDSTDAANCTGDLGKSRKTVRLSDSSDVATLRRKPIGTTAYVPLIRGDGGVGPEKQLISMCAGFPGTPAHIELVVAESASTARVTL